MTAPVMTLAEALALVDTVTPAPAVAHQALLTLRAELARRERDTARLDWLADVDNHLGGVQLPLACVLENVDDMRAAIDAAMALPQPAAAGAA
jgi:hypothetical protein